MRISFIADCCDCVFLCYRYHRGGLQIRTQREGQIHRCYLKMSRNYRSIEVSEKQVIQYITWGLEPDVSPWFQNYSAVSLG